MIISEKSTKAVFISLVCISLGALLGVEVKSQQSMEETGATHIEVDSEAPEIDAFLRP